MADSTLTTDAASTGAMEPEKSLRATTKDAGKGLKASHFALAVRVLLPLFDMVTDAYTMYRYYDRQKNLMRRAFYASLGIMLIHNLVSTAHGAFRLSSTAGRDKVLLWSSWKWKSMAVALHLLGAGSLVIPVEMIVRLALRRNADGR